MLIRIFLLPPPSLAVSQLKPKDLAEQLWKHFLTTQLHIILHSVTAQIAFSHFASALRRAPPQLEPKDLAEQLKKTGAAIPAIRPGKQTAEYVTRTLTRMSLLGSVFLGALSATPALVEGVTGLTAFRGFAGTSVLIMVGWRLAVGEARQGRGLHWGARGHLSAHRGGLVIGGWRLGSRGQAGCTNFARVGHG